MKKVLLILMAVFGFSTVFSQVSIGVAGGINICNVTPLSSNTNSTIGDIADFITGNQNLQYDQDKPVNGGYAGLVFQCKMNKLLTLRSGLRWIQKGWLFHRFNNDIIELNQWDKQYKINFLELPVDLEYGTPVGAGRAFIGAGPFLSYGINGRIQNNLKYLPGNQIYNAKDTAFSATYFARGARKWEWGVNGILGYEFKVGVFVSVEYELSLKSILNTVENQRLSVFQFGIGYILKRW